MNEGLRFSPADPPETLDQRVLACAEQVLSATKPRSLRPTRLPIAEKVGYVTVLAAYWLYAVGFALRRLFAG